MKIIDLLNKIANGEEVPERIRIREVEFKFTEIVTRNLTYSDRGSNINYAYENDFENYWLDCARINEEVEILEDKPKHIEEIPKEEIECSMAIGEQMCAKKINELSKAVNYLLDKEGK